MKPLLSLSSVSATACVRVWIIGTEKLKTGCGVTPLKTFAFNCVAIAELAVKSLWASLISSNSLSKNPTRSTFL